jgi:hypothetical protein
MSSFREATFSKGGDAPKMSDLKAPTYEYRHAQSRALTVWHSSPQVGALTVRHPFFREATFSKGGGAPKMSDLKAPTYEDRHAQSRVLTVWHSSP